MTVRLVLSPVAGAFRPRSAAAPRGLLVVESGEPLGTVFGRGIRSPVPCGLTGVFMEWLALEGERLRPGQPVAWLEAPAPFPGGRPR